MISSNRKLVNRIIVVLLMLSDGLIHGLWASGKIDKFHLGAILSITAAIIYMIVGGIVLKTGHILAELVIRHAAFIAMCIGLFFSCTILDFVAFGGCMMLVINQPCSLSDMRNNNDEDDSE